MSPVSLQLQHFLTLFVLSFFNLYYFTAFVCLCGLMLVVSECAAALPMVERVGLVTGDFGVLGGEGEADLPEKKDSSYRFEWGLGCYVLLLAHMLFSAKL